MVNDMVLHVVMAWCSILNPSFFHVMVVHVMHGFVAFQSFGFNLLGFLHDMVV